MAGWNTYAYPTHANTQEYWCATHVSTTTHTARAVCTPLHKHTAVTMLSAQRISSAVYIYLHTQVMEGICTAGTLEEGEVVWQVRTRTRVLHTQTHRSTAALHMHVVHTASAAWCAEIPPQHEEVVRRKV